MIKLTKTIIKFIYKLRKNPVIAPIISIIKYIYSFKIIKLIVSLHKYYRLILVLLTFLSSSVVIYYGDFKVLTDTNSYYVFIVGAFETFLNVIYERYQYILRFIIEKLNHLLTEPFELRVPTPNKNRSIGWEGWDPHNYKMDTGAGYRDIDIRDLNPSVEEHPLRSWYRSLKLHLYDNAYYYIGAGVTITFVYLGYEWYSLYPNDPTNVTGERLGSLWSHAVKPLFNPIWALFGGLFSKKPGIDLSDPKFKEYYYKTRDAHPSLPSRPVWIGKGRGGRGLSISYKIYTQFNH